MNRYDSLPEAVTDLFGDEAAAERAYDLLTVDVPVTDWLDALRTARDELGCTYFDWLSAVDEPGTGFRVCAHVVALERGRVRRLLLRTTVPHEAPTLPTAVGVYAGAAWHERETHEMFGVVFEGHPNLTPLLLPENFEGHPLRKDFVLAARVAKAWPGAKEPGEAHDGGPKRRQMLPPGVPDPNEWGPLKGQLPPAPERPARAAAANRPRRTRTAAAGSATQTPPAAPEAGAPPARRTRSAAAGSASQTPPAAPAAPETPATGAPPAAPEAPAAPPAARRTRSASEGSASQTAPGTPRRMRSASQGSASQQAEQAAEPPAAPSPPPRTRSTDAPWHHARPAFDEPPAPEATPAAGGPAPATPDATPAAGEPGPEAKPDATPAAGGPALEATPDATPAAGEPAPEATPDATPAAGEPAPEATPDATPAAGEPAPEAKPDVEPAADGPAPEARPAAGDPDRDPDRDRDPDTDTHPDPAGGDPA
ncbi:NADH-quinone oxidoreductase subunit C [Streptomyces sp. NRRL F-5727]|uniref:NADH-quinone oxidoreductase subunit C n=1 Tax=Streptomyces sp. NRRL F-5727 TaxID=1463871 RepID=UPI000569287E|nr:NADH-quinone oxidoreductase subunit C [Streptomyces sp. NRRL F-5727]